MLYTIILDFEGTNSVSQISAADPEAAIGDWVSGLNRPSNYGLPKEQAETVAEGLETRRRLRHAGSEAMEFDNYEPALLTGMKNAWCVVGYGETTVLLNIVATVS
jgi:hypothetical protein